MLYESFRNDMLFAAHSILLDYALAEDAVQNAFMRVAQCINKIDLTRNPRSLLIKIAVFCAKDLIRENSHETSLPDDFFQARADESGDPLQVVEKDDIISQISQVVARLPEEYRDVFIMKYKYELPNSTIAAMCAISNAAVRKRLQRIREIIRKYLAERGAID